MKKHRAPGSHQQVVKDGNWKPVWEPFEQNIVVPQGLLSSGASWHSRDPAVGSINAT